MTPPTIPKGRAAVARWAAGAVSFVGNKMLRAKLHAGRLDARPQPRSWTAPQIRAPIQRLRRRVTPVPLS